MNARIMFYFLLVIKYFVTREYRKLSSNTTNVPSSSIKSQ